LSIEAFMNEASEKGLTPDLLRLMFDAIATKTEEPLDSLRLEIKEVGGEWSSDAQMRHWSVPLLAENLGRWLLEQGGENFAEVQLCLGAPRDPDVPKVAVTVQRIGGKSPAHLLAEAKAEIARLEALLEDQKDEP